MNAYANEFIRMFIRMTGWTDADEQKNSQKFVFG